MAKKSATKPRPAKPQSETAESVQDAYERVTHGVQCAREIGFQVCVIVAHMQPSLDNCETLLTRLNEMRQHFAYASWNRDKLNPARMNVAPPATSVFDESQEASGNLFSAIVSFALIATGNTVGSASEILHLRKYDESWPDTAIIEPFLLMEHWDTFTRWTRDAITRFESSLPDLINRRMVEDALAERWIIDRYSKNDRTQTRHGRDMPKEIEKTPRLEAATISMCNHLRDNYTPDQELTAFIEAYLLKKALPANKKAVASAVRLANRHKGKRW